MVDGMVENQQSKRKVKIELEEWIVLKLQGLKISVKETYTDVLKRLLKC